jgi:hypothetical protein
MPRSPGLDSPQEEHAQMLAALRRARYGSLLALPILLLCAAGRRPTAIAAGLFCARSSVYRAVRASRQGTMGVEPDDHGPLAPPVRPTVLRPTRRRALLALCHAGPDAASEPGDDGLGGDEATRAPRDRLGGEAGHAGGHR